MKTPEIAQPLELLPGRVMAREVGSFAKLRLGTNQKLAAQLHAHMVVFGSGKGNKSAPAMRRLDFAWLENRQSN